MGFGFCRVWHGKQRIQTTRRRCRVSEASRHNRLSPPLHPVRIKSTPSPGSKVPGAEKFARSEAEVHASRIAQRYADRLAIQRRAFRVARLDTGIGRIVYRYFRSTSCGRFIKGCVRCSGRRSACPSDRQEYQARPRHGRGLRSNGAGRSCATRSTTKKIGVINLHRSIASRRESRPFLQSGPHLRQRDLWLPAIVNREVLVGHGVGMADVTHCFHGVEVSL